MQSSVTGESTAFEALVRASPAAGVARPELSWKGFSVLGHRGDSGERAESVQEQHIIGLWRGHTAIGERLDGRSEYIP